MARPVLSDLDMGSVARILNLLDPTAAQHPATKAYVDALVQGLAWKDNVRVATSSNVNLASPGGSLDGVAMSAGDRFLARAQTAGAENGIYVWNGASTPATRSADTDAAAELLSAVVTVDEGTDADTTWRMDTISITLGTTALVWVAFGTATPDASTSTKGKVQIATQGEVNTGTDALKAVTPATFKGSSLRSAGYATDIGDGSATSYTVTHNFNTRDVIVQVRQNAGNYEEVDCEIRVNNVNSIDLLFAAAPSSNALRVLVMTVPSA